MANIVVMIMVVDNRNNEKRQTFNAWDDKNYFDSVPIWSKTTKNEVNVFKKYNDIITSYITLIDFFEKK